MTRAFPLQGARGRRQGKGPWPHCRPAVEQAAGEDLRQWPPGVARPRGPEALVTAWACGTVGDPVLLP